MRASTPIIRWSGIAAMLGGMLWLPYGVSEMLEPWGAATAPYREDVGYEVVTDASRYIAYSMPGSLALLLSALGLLGALAQIGPRTGRLGGIGRILTYIAVALAVVSLVGVMLLFDPVFTAGRIFGTLALGAAAFLVGVDVWRAGGRRSWAFTLIALGLIGMFLFPLWPLVYAIEWLSEAAGAAVIAVFGLGWVALGGRLTRGTIRATNQDNTHKEGSSPRHP